jgi:hypothetical protein
MVVSARTQLATTSSAPFIRAPPASFTIERTNNDPALETTLSEEFATIVNSVFGGDPISTTTTIIHNSSNSNNCSNDNGNSSCPITAASVASSNLSLSVYCDGALVCDGPLVPASKTAFATYPGGFSLLVKQSSVCPGIGVYATEPIPADTFLGVYEGAVSSHLVDSNEYFFGITETFGIDGSINGNWTMLMNHDSSESRGVSSRVVSSTEEFETVIKDDGSWVEIVKSDGGWCEGKRVEFYTRRRIDAGEELFFDYGREFAAWIDDKKI